MYETIRWIRVDFVVEWTNVKFKYKNYRVIGNFLNGKMYGFGTATLKNNVKYAGIFESRKLMVRGI